MSSKLALVLGIPALLLGFWLTQCDGRAPLTTLVLDLAPELEARSAETLVAPAEEAPRETAPQQQRAPVPPRHSTAAPAPVAKPETAERTEVNPTELAGRVVGPLGTAPGAHVSLLRGEARGFDLLDPTESRTTELVAETIADGRGEFRFALDRGMPVDVHAELGNALSADAPNHFAGQFVELVLDAGHLIHGHVTRASDGGPVEGARVRAVGPRTPVLERETRTLADGSYAVRVTFTENATLAVSHPTDGIAPWIDVRFGSDGNAQEDVVLEPGITVEGRVTDAETGEPIGGATVGESWMFVRSVTTDRHGAYRLTNCTPGTPDLHARAGGHGGAVPSGPPRMVDGRMRLDFQLRSAHTAIGRIVDDSAEPVAGAYVAAVGQGGHTDWIATRTDADGRFALEPLAAEIHHVLFVSRRGFAVQVYEFPASELGQITTDLGQLTLRSGQLVAGRVREESGKPVADAVVTLKGWNNDRFVLAGGDTGTQSSSYFVAQRRTFSDEQGRFWFGAVATGNFQLAAVKSGRVASEKVSLLVQEGTDRDDLELVFATGLAIRGLVRGEAGHALPNARVSVMLETEDGSFSGSLPVSRVDAGGAFEILGLADGMYQLEAYPVERDVSRDEPWLPTYLEHVSPGGEPVTLVLERGVTIEGVLHDAHGKPAASVYVQPRIDGWIARVEGDTSDVEGRFRLVVPKNTRWTIDVYSDSFGDEAVLSEPGIAAGTRDLELTLPAE